MVSRVAIQRNESILIGSSTTKSRDRVKAQAEVFTASDQVTAMLDLVKNCSDNIDSRFLEPSCGNGNFLVAILNRKMSVVAQRYRKQIDYEFYSLVALASIYGVEICIENVNEARERLKVLIKEWYSDKLNTKKPSDGFYRSVDYILDKNIVLCDMLNDFEKITVTEFSIPKPYKFKENNYFLADLMGAQNDLVSPKRNPKPQSFGPIKNYLELANV